MNSQSYKIKIRATVNGVTVVPTNIAWIHGNDSCLVTPCYKENDYIIVEIIPDCIGDNCIEGWIQFGSDCANCEPIYFKRCFCSSNDDCEECEDCNQYGICQSRCLVDEFCDNGECCNCNETTPCPANKICNGCKCVCPQGTFEKNGICVECDENTVLDKCHICVNGVIVPIPCDGACDPATGQCVDCLTGGDCSSRLDGKTCCVDKVCVCCRGTVWDPILKMCVPQPCASDDECGPCEKCTPEGCKPIICPPNYKCIDGECVYWPCLSTSCENGADCGPECGCVIYEGVKQCVPCHILECLGLCEEALGCECKGTVCGPVDDCGSVYCDGTTPCLQPGCTCYNNRCVSCENFPCDPDDCTTRYNCGCIDGDCGAADCNDSIDLIKKENCSTDTGCELSAEYTSTKKCMCEAVEFRTKNTKTCTTAGVNGDGTATTSVSDILILKTELFKNNVPYADYLNQISMADNELVSGSITTTVSHYVKNNLGVFTQVNPSVTGVDVVSIIDNTVNDIKITTSNVKTNAFITELVNGTNVTTNRPTKVVIELRATNVKIDANDCKQYGTKVIATYELDYTTVSTVCAKINNYKTQQLAFLNDSKSIRKPFFVWHKSTTSTFSNAKYDTNNGNYSNSGWFRKQFGSKVGDKWIDKINHPKKHVQGEFNELWNNLNYKVKVDCGCKANDATLQKVIFCCPKDFKYNATYDCGTKIIVDAFDTCAVNKNLNPYLVGEYDIPTQSQTFYWMIINGTTEISLRPAGGNLITPYTYTHTEPITSVAFEQRYIDTPLVATACPVSYVETPVLPEFNPVLSCDPTVIDVMKVSHPNLQSVTAQKISGLDAGPTIYPLAQQTSKFTTSTTTLTSPLRTVGSVKLTATFTNGCKTVKTIDITGNCSPVVTAVSAPSAISYANCVGGGSNPDIVAQPSGFGPNVEYSLDGVLFQSSPTFSNKVPGVYTVTARETIDGVLYTAVSAPVTITAAIQPTIGVSGSLCSGTTVTLTITGAPSSTFNFTLPNGTSSIITLNSLGIFEYTVTTATAGLYRATLSTNPTGVSCSPVVLEQLVGADGAHLIPTIILDGISCQGQPRRFRIDDGGANQTYTLTGINGTLSSPTVTASATFDNTFTPNTTISSVIAIVAIANNCYTFSTSFTTVPSTSAPMITSVASECVAFSPDKFEITVNTSSAATVSIGATTATTISSTQYKFYLFETAAGTDVVINATSGGCTYTTTHTLPTCSPDEGSIIVESNSPTCGQMNTTVDVTSVDFGYIIGEFYQWYEVIGGVDVAIGGTPGVIVSNVPSLTVFSTNSEKQYKVKIFKANGSIAESNVAPVIAGNTFTPTIIGAPTVDTGASSNYYATPVADSYLWTLSNSVVTNQVIGTESSVNVLFAIPDNNVISLTATTALCGSVTTSIPVVSTSNCAAMSVAITVPGSCDPNVFATVNTGGTGATVVSQTWTGTGIASSTYVGNATIFRTLSDLTTGQTVPDLTVSVTFSNGCVKTSTISYQRCTCYCTGTVCSISNTILSDTNIVVAVDDSSYGIDGTIFITDPIPIIYVDGDPLPGGPVINAGALPWDATNSALNNSRLNLSSVYNTTGKVSFRTLATGNADAVGFAADNGGTLTIAGDVIFSLSDPSISGNNTPFKKWWVIDYPVTAGDCIEYTAQNLGTISPTNPFAVGFETYSVNAVALAALGSVAAVNLVVVDSSRTLMGSTIAYGCPNGSAPTTGCTPICNCPTYPS